MTRITQFLRQFAALAPVLGLALVGITAAPAQETKKLPYVYTKWKNFTVADGLPNDHIFSVKADGDRVWIGTEDGLAMYDKKTGKMKSWTEKDGLPWRAITGIDVDKKTGDVWLALFGGGLARFSGGRFDHFTQMNSGVRRGRRERQHLGGYHGGREPLQQGQRRVDDFHREERADGRDLELQRELQRAQHGVPGGVGQRRSGVRH
jgi:hypothetical protein